MEGGGRYLPGTISHPQDHPLLRMRALSPYEMQYKKAYLILFLSNYSTEEGVPSLHGIILEGEQHQPPLSFSQNGIRTRAIQCVQ